MDAPIYLMFINEVPMLKRPYGDRYKWYVIEEKTTTAAAPVDELSSDLLWCCSGHDIVRHIRLPPLDYDVGDSNEVSTVVSNNRIFFIGGMSRDEEDEDVDNGIISIDLRDKGNLSWKQCDRWAQHCVSTNWAVYNKQDDDIYALSSSNKAVVLRFDCSNIEKGQLLAVPDIRKSLLVTSTDREMLMYKCDDFVREFRFFGMTSLSSSSSLITPSWSSLPCRGEQHHYPYMCNVVVRWKEGEHLVYFLRKSPLVNNSGKYCPGLYVYDIRLGEWLPKRVQGLRYDGVTFPSLDRLFVYASLMRVNVDKLALVWAIETQNGCGYNPEAEVHWSKFKLIPKVDVDNTICYHSEILSHGTCSGGTSSYMRSAVDVGI